MNKQQNGNRIIENKEVVTRGNGAGERKERDEGD